ncbi:MAG TPA: zinc ribbon domain-containing protein, partial [Candidatus Sulfotelmatobacter sp.]|nr:zinc ribbon domain-containing protein [Candidatus Sulfotelmatobacter sp.]
MGRWAEVYFTSPPENREQAVLDLLRELEADKSRREAHLASELAAQPPLVRCENCGYDNPATNRFCGMCGGVALAEAKSSAEGFAQHEANDNSDRHTEPRVDAPYSFGDSSAPRHELSLFQAYRETDAGGNDDWNYEPVASSSYRGYIGVVLALLILGLGYM